MGVRQGSVRGGQGGGGKGHHRACPRRLSHARSWQVPPVSATHTNGASGGEGGGGGGGWGGAGFGGVSGSSTSPTSSTCGAVCLWAARAQRHGRVGS